MSRSAANVTLTERAGELSPHDYSAFLGTAKVSCSSDQVNCWLPSPFSLNRARDLFGAALVLLFLPLTMTLLLVDLISYKRLVRTVLFELGMTSIVIRLNAASCTRRFMRLSHHTGISGDRVRAIYVRQSPNYWYDMTCTDDQIGDGKRDSGLTDLIVELADGSRVVVASHQPRCWMLHLARAAAHHCRAPDAAQVEVVDNSSAHSHRARGICGSSSSGVDDVHLGHTATRFEIDRPTPTQTRIRMAPAPCADLYRMLWIWIVVMGVFVVITPMAFIHLAQIGYGNVPTIVLILMFEGFGLIAISLLCIVWYFWMTLKATIESGRIEIGVDGVLVCNGVLWLGLGKSRMFPTDAIADIRAAPTDNDLFDLRIDMWTGRSHSFFLGRRPAELLLIAATIRDHLAQCSGWRAASEHR